MFVLRLPTDITNLCTYIYVQEGGGGNWGVSKMIPYGVCIFSIARKTRKIITVT